MYTVAKIAMAILLVLRPTIFTRLFAMIKRDLTELVLAYGEKKNQKVAVNGEDASRP